MRLHQFLQDVGLELQELFLRDVPYRKTQDELDRLEARLHEQAARLDDLRATVNKLSQGLAEKERRAAWLEERVAIYLHISDRPSAWRYALELDRTRKELAAEHDQFRRQHQAYHLQRAQVEALSRRLASLREGASVGGERGA